VIYKPTAMMTPATMNEELTGAFWKKGATTDAVKIILPVSVRTSAARLFCLSVSSNKQYAIIFVASCQFLSPCESTPQLSYFSTSQQGKGMDWLSTCLWQRSQVKLESRRSQHGNHGGNLSHSDSAPTYNKESERRFNRRRLPRKPTGYSTRHGWRQAPRRQIWRSKRPGQHWSKS
jgi:hypothetical protein